MTFKLFKVTLRGGINPGSTNYNASFVVAESPDAAYQAVRDFLDKNDLCYDDEREVTYPPMNWRACLYAKSREAYGRVTLLPD